MYIIIIIGMNEVDDDDNDPDDVISVLRLTHAKQ